jgi:hypothetical protein
MYVHTSYEFSLVASKVKIHIIKWDMFCSAVFVLGVITKFFGAWIRRFLVFEGLLNEMEIMYTSEYEYFLTFL